VNTTSSHLAVNVIYPQTKKLEEEQRNFVSSLLNRIDTLVSSNSQANEAELEQLMSLPSLARYFVLQEIAEDVDGYALSDFLKIVDGKLHHAAPWDFDLAFHFACMPLYFHQYSTHKVMMGVEGWNVEAVRDSAMWVSPVTGVPSGSVINFGRNIRLFFLRLWRQHAFRRAFGRMWQQARQGSLSDAALSRWVGSNIARLNESATHDISLWRHTQRCAFFTCCQPADIHTFVGSALHLKEYLLARVAWIDANIGELSVSVS
jgi:hypothetical protein